MSGPAVTRSYSKINAAEDSQLKRKSRRRCCFTLFCSALVVAAIVCVAVALVHRRTKYDDSSDDDEKKKELSQGSMAIQAACETTMYPQLCIEALSAQPDALLADPVQLVTIGVKIALNHVNAAYQLAAQFNGTDKGEDLLQSRAIQDCLQLMDDAQDHLTDSIASLSSLSTFDLLSLKNSLSDIKVLLSSSLSCELACSDGFDTRVGNVASSLLNVEGDVSNGIIIALGLVDTLSKLGNDLSSWKSALPSKPHIPHPHLRRLLSEKEAESGGSSWADEFSTNGQEFPRWLSAADRKLLQAPTSSIAPNLVVAKDGSGNYKTIQDAVNSVPLNHQGRYIIHIKSGTYNEYVTIPKKLISLTLIGDGIESTVITGNKNNKQNITTFDTATVAISGASFIARDITFQNTAGPAGFQAVAVRASADFIVFDTCSFEGYQDTLYALASRQFYRGCKIYGTVDFIFGNAIAIFQNCDLLARQPLQYQSNTYTAHGRKTSSDPSGFSFQKCTLSADTDLQSSPYAVSSYLGRPWKAYSRTVFLQSMMGGLIDPAGWLAWNASNPFTDTIYYGEYENTGPGSNTDQRVSWAGVHPRMSLQDASQFTVEQFISGSRWLPQANVVFEDSLN